MAPDREPACPPSSLGKVMQDASGEGPGPPQTLARSGLTVALDALHHHSVRPSLPTLFRLY